MFFGIAIDPGNNKIYWTEITPDRAIKRSNLDGTDKETVLSENVGSLRDIQIDPLNERLYWTENRRIGTVNIDGSEAEILVPTGETNPLEWVWWFEIDPIDQKLYWSDLSNGKIQRLDIESGEIEDLFDFETSVRLALVYNQHTSTSVDENDEKPVENLLIGNFPNPFRSQTTFTVNLIHEEELSIKVFDSLGRQVSTIIENRRVPPGSHQFIWAPGNAPSGVYYYKVEKGDRISSHKMIFIK